MSEFSLSRLACGQGQVWHVSRLLFPAGFLFQFCPCHRSSCNDEWKYAAPCCTCAYTKRWIEHRLPVCRLLEAVLFILSIMRGRHLPSVWSRNFLRIITLVFFCCAAMLCDSMHFPSFSAWPSSAWRFPHTRAIGSGMKSGQIDEN